MKKPNKKQNEILYQRLKEHEVYWKNQLITEVKKMIDETGLKEAIDSFERVEKITDIIILGEKGGVRRLIIE